MPFILSVSELHYILDLRDDKGNSLLDRAINNMYEEVYPEVALYLMNKGCETDKESLTKLFCEACRTGKLEIVKELIEQHKLDPKSEPLKLICSID